MSTKTKPKITVTFVKPGDTTKPQRRPSRVQVGLRPQMSQFYSMKATLENLLGHQIYLKIKESARILDWKNATCRLLDAIAVAISSTVFIADQDWHIEIANEIERGKNAIKSSEEIGELFAGLSATLAHIVFHQIGQVPVRRTNEKAIPLTARFWNLNGHRSVQYVQNRAQIVALADAKKGAGL